jgi:RNA polymerase sigma factor for flagellar operon FliA
MNPNMPTRPPVSGAASDLCRAADLPTSSLWQRFRQPGCQEARARLIQSYAFLVPATVGRLLIGRPRFLDRDDLRATGILGLIRAVDTFDPARRVKFETYAIGLIRATVLETLRSADWASRLVRARQKNLHKTCQMLEVRLGRPPTGPELASALGLTVSELERLSADIVRATVLSLDAPPPDLEPLTLAGLVAASDADPFEQAALHERDHTLHAAIGRLPEREAAVVRLYYESSLSFRQIGCRLGLSESRACQLHAQALRRLRAYLAATGIDAP